MATYRERGLVSLAISTANEELLIQGEGNGKHTDKVEVYEGIESIVQFKVRMADGLVQGISFGVLTAKAVLQAQVAR